MDAKISTLMVLLVTIFIPINGEELLLSKCCDCVKENVCKEGVIDVYGSGVIEPRVGVSSTTSNVTRDLSCNKKEEVCCMYSDAPNWCSEKMVLQSHGSICQGIPFLSLIMLFLYGIVA